MDLPDGMGSALAAESRIAELKHQLGEYADKLDCMVDPEEHRQKLATVRAEEREIVCTVLEKYAESALDVFAEDGGCAGIVAEYLTEIAAAIRAREGK